MFEIMKRVSQQTHDKMVNDIVNHLRNNYFSDIKADLPGKVCPDKIVRHIPDITASKGMLRYIIEIETYDTIDIEHTKDQWKEFAKYASQRSDRKLVVVVPEGYKPKAQKVLNELSITAEIWTVG